MKEKVYTFEMQLDFDISNLISKIDRFDASWTTIEKLQGDALNHLKTVATIQSVGASTRIEGSKLTDKQVKDLLTDIDVSQLIDRDKQEVAGYYQALDLITEAFTDIPIIEGNIKNLHNILLKFSEKDKWHQGDYKKHSNVVEATFPDGSKQVVFKTTEPGYPTEDAMRSLINWFNKKDNTPPLIKAAAFVYDFLSIHPFQDGNGRLSRLLTTLLLLQSGFLWIQYVSLENEIEKNKKEYYNVLRRCQVQRPNEDITDWIEFFLRSLLNIQKKLDAKINMASPSENLSLKQKEIYIFLSENPESQMSTLIAEINSSKTVINKLLKELLDMELIVKNGVGRGINYSVK
jgi:Fic family protein